MTSTVQLRRPKNSGAPASRIGRPKSWTEFNTRFQAFSTPVNIDLTPVPLVDETTVKRREPNNYRKVRPYSASLLDQPEGGLKIGGGSDPPSPKYTSFMVPNPWRNASKTEPKSPKTPKANEQLKNNCDQTTGHYDKTANVINRKISDQNTPEAKIKSKSQQSDTFGAKSRHSGSFSDSDSIDSAVVVSGASTPHGVSSEKSPRWRYSSRDSRSSSDFDPVKSATQIPSDLHAVTSNKKKKSWDKSPIERPTTLQKTAGKSSPNSDETSSSSSDQNSTVSLTLSPPQILVTPSKEVVKMEFFPDDDVIRFEESPNEYDEGRSIVPSPLKSCYAPAATYDDPVDYSDSDNSSGDENPDPDRSRMNISSNRGYEGDRSAEEYIPAVRPRQTSSMRSAKRNDASSKNDVRKSRHDVRGGTWPRRRSLKKHAEEDTVDWAQLLTKFKKTRENHLARFKDIYEDSRKRLDEVMENLKRSMTENGYREYYPRVR